MRSLVERSAQWTSSTIRSTGRTCFVSRSRTRSTACSVVVWPSSAPPRTAVVAADQPQPRRVGPEDVGRRRAGGRRPAGRAQPMTEVRQRLDDGRVGDAAHLEVEAPPDQDLHVAGAGPPRQLGHEARLADPCLAAHEHGRAAAFTAGVEHFLQAGEFPDATDQRRGVHPTDCRPPVGAAVKRLRPRGLRAAARRRALAGRRRQVPAVHHQVAGGDPQGTSAGTVPMGRSAGCPANRLAMASRKSAIELVGGDVIVPADLRLPPCRAGCPAATPTCGRRRRSGSRGPPPSTWNTAWGSSAVELCGSTSGVSMSMAALVCSMASIGPSR